MYEDSLSYKNEIKKHIPKEKTGNYIIIVLIVIVLIVSYFLFFKDLFKSKYTKMEEEMVNAARDLVIINGITTNREIYLDVNKLNISLDDECSLTSGVIYDGNNYVPN